MPQTTKSPGPESLAANGNGASQNYTGQILPLSLENRNGTLLDTLGKHWNYAPAERRMMYVRYLQLTLTESERHSYVAQRFDNFDHAFQFALVGVIVSCLPWLFRHMVADGVL